MLSKLIIFKDGSEILLLYVPKENQWYLPVYVSEFQIEQELGIKIENISKIIQRKNLEIYYCNSWTGKINNNKKAIKWFSLEQIFKMKDIIGGHLSSNITEIAFWIRH